MKKVKNFSKFISKAGNWKLLNMYAKASAQFRDHHNNLYKPALSQEDYVKWNDIISEDWVSRPQVHNLSKNRQFDVYHFPSLEASSKNCGKLRYSRKHLRRDLEKFFPYLPKQEIQRFVYVLTWLVAEALKNYGNICIPNIGTLYMYDKPIRETHRAFTSKRWSQPRFRITRKIEFFPATYLYNICTPRDLVHMGLEGKYNRAQYIPSIFGSFVDERIHRYRGRVFLTDVFTKHWEWLGYEDDCALELRNLGMYDAIDDEMSTENFIETGNEYLFNNLVEKAKKKSIGRVESSAEMSW